MIFRLIQRAMGGLQLAEVTAGLLTRLSPTAASVAPRSGETPLRSEGYAAVDHHCAFNPSDLQLKILKLKRRVVHGEQALWRVANAYRCYFMQDLHENLQREGLTFFFAR